MGFGNFRTFLKRTGRSIKRTVVNHTPTLNSKTARARIKDLGRQHIEHVARDLPIAGALAGGVVGGVVAGAVDPYLKRIADHKAPAVHGSEVEHSAIVGALEGAALQSGLSALENGSISGFGQTLSAVSGLESLGASTPTSLAPGLADGSAADAAAAGGGGGLTLVPLLVVGAGIVVVVLLLRKR